MADKGQPEMVKLVEKTLQQMQGKFEASSDRLVGKIDDMGAKIDDLEKCIADLMEEAGAPAGGAGQGGAPEK